MRRIKEKLLLVLFFGLVASCVLYAQEKRSIHVLNDNGNSYIYTKVYELKHIKARDIEPYIKRCAFANDDTAAFKTLNYSFGKRQFLIVSTTTTQFPYIDEIVKQFDRPGIPTNKLGFSVQGDGIYSFAYKPKFRSSGAMARVLMKMQGGSIARYFVDSFTNNLYWKDSYSGGGSSLGFMKDIDVPVPQINLEMKVYELSDTNLRELGIDWLQWKNGPGANLFSAGADLMAFSQQANAPGGIASTSTGVLSNALGGFLFAPQIDFTYVRLLAQKGRARVYSSGHITVMNQLENRNGQNQWGDVAGSSGLYSYDLQVTTNDQYLQKSPSTDEITVDNNSIDFHLTLTKPIITFPNGVGGEAILNASYNLQAANTVSDEMNQDGSNNAAGPITNSITLDSDFYAVTGQEMIVGSYVNDYNIKQKNGIPWLSELPILEYIFGAKNEAWGKNRTFITLKTNLPDDALSDMHLKHAVDFENER